MNHHDIIFAHYLHYSQFLSVINEHHSQRLTIEQVLERVAVLFANEVDLLGEFAYFLPLTVQEEVQLVSCSRALFIASYELIRTIYYCFRPNSEWTKLCKHLSPDGSSDRSRSRRSCSSRSHRLDRRK